MNKTTDMKTVVVIPARLESRRLPGKVLLPIAGRPMLAHVCERVQQCRTVDAVYVTTDSLNVAHVAQQCGVPAIMSSPDCENGTHRIATILPQIPGDLIVNVQADELLVSPAMVDRLVRQSRRGRAPVTTPVFRISTAAELRDPNLVKVARGASGRALYFSRSPVPHVRDRPLVDWLEYGEYFGHIGVYAFDRAVLAQYPRLPASALESCESLEQLRLIEAGIEIQTVCVKGGTGGINTLADLEHVRKAGICSFLEIANALGGHA